MLLADKAAQSWFKNGRHIYRSVATLVPVPAKELRALLDTMLEFNMSCIIVSRSVTFS